MVTHLGIILGLYSLTSVIGPFTLTTFTFGEAMNFRSNFFSQEDTGSLT